METTTIDKDITVFYITANPFPDDVPAAYGRLHTLITDDRERRYFGISHPNEKGIITYKAAAEELEDGEAEKYGCETFTIKKGKFIYTDIKNHSEDGTNIGNAFHKLLKNPNIDPQGYCLEYYLNYTDPDVRCMVGLK